MLVILYYFTIYAFPSSDPRSMEVGKQKLGKLFIRHGVAPFTPLKGLFIQGPIFMSFFFAILNMVEKVPSLKGGGALVHIGLLI